MDAHVAGVDHEILELNTEGKKYLHNRIKNMTANPFMLILVAERPYQTGLLAMGSIAIWHQAKLWKNPERQGLSYAMIDDLWVEPAERKSGVGKALLKRLIAFADTHGVNDLMLEYATTNTEAQATWSRLGFHTTGVRAAASIEEVQSRLGK